jgi:ABC-type transport system substrate-binding protein
MRNVSLWRRSAQAALGLALGASLAACGSASPTSAGNSDTIVIAENQAMDAFDPIKNLGGDQNGPLDTTIFETLATTNVSGQVSPLLATSWTVAPDGKTYTFQLRHDVKFQDGHPFTSADVVYSFNRAAKEADPQVLQRFSSYQSATAEGSYTVKVELKQADTSFIYQVADPTDIGFAIVPNGATSAQINNHPVGTGPFSFVSYQPNAQLELAVNRNYWNPSVLPKYKTLKIRFIADDASAVAALKSGQVQMIWPQSTPTVTSLKSQSGVKVGGLPSGGFWLSISRVGATASPDIAKAIALAIDRSALVKVAFSGDAVPGTTAPPSVSYATPLSKLPNYTRDVEGAKALLAAAGHPKGIDLTIIWPQRAPFSESLFDVLQTSLAEAGIRLKLQPLDPAVWVPRFINAQYDLSITDQSWYSDPGRYVLPRSGWQAPPAQVLPQLTTLLNQYQGASAADKPAIFRQIQQLEAGNAYPFIGLVWTTHYVAYNSKTLSVGDIQDRITGSRRGLYLSLTSH